MDQRQLLIDEVAALLDLYNPVIDILIYPGGYGGEFVANFIVENSTTNYFIRPTHHTTFAQQRAYQCNRHKYNGLTFPTGGDAREFKKFLSCTSFTELLQHQQKFYHPMLKNLNDIKTKIYEFNDSDTERMLMITHLNSDVWNMLFPDSTIYVLGDKTIRKKEDHDKLDIIYFRLLLDIKLKTNPVNIVKFKELYYDSDINNRMTYDEYISLHIDMPNRNYTDRNFVIKLLGFNPFNPWAFNSTGYPLKPIEDGDILDSYYNSPNTYLDIPKAFKLKSNVEFYNHMNNWFNMNNILIKNHHGNYWPIMLSINVKEYFLNYDK